MLDDTLSVRHNVAVVTKWRDCRDQKERSAALIAAFKEGRGIVSVVATLLGVNRQHLYKIMKQLGDPRTDMPDTVGRFRLVGRTDNVAPEHGERGAETVGPTSDGSITSLTHGGKVPTLDTVSSAATVTPTERKIRTAVDLPKSLKDRVEKEALRANQAGETDRFNKSDVIVKALKLYFGITAGDDEDDQ